jgi:hypothetical protein
VIFSDVTSPVLHSLWLTVGSNHGSSLEAFMVLEKPTPVMNYALENKAASAFPALTVWMQTSGLCA